ncbi:MAG: alcohol dehydrogenase catalytic domain-containing protein [Kiritimatiellaeota bacterium]|nr:alcohol dehydrogenase catalytic domain-containing protein [Kiritimatiellota bacterium]
MADMLAAVLHDFDDLRLERVPRPEPTNFGEVSVRIRACGVCQTDYKAWRGMRRNVSFPTILGHEPSGVVAAVGPGVTHFKPGDEVICQPSGFCGICDDCRSGRTHYCRNAFVTGGDGPDDVWDGAFAEYMLTRETCLHAKPSELSFDAAALTEPLSGAWKGMVQYSDTRIGDDVVVIGVGGIGLLCLMVARAAGAGTLIAVDPSAFARRNALQLGATHAVDPARGDIREQVYAILPQGPDVIVEAAGPIEAVETMMALRRRGTRCNLFGITTHEAFELDGGYTHFLEARLDASFGTNPAAMVRAIRLMRRGLVDVERIISHTFRLEDIHRAMEVMGSVERNKIMIHP